MNQNQKMEEGHDVRVRRPLTPLTCGQKPRSVRTDGMSSTTDLP
eukprot:SAG22_NODE_205_length_15308_cov_20.539023_12_plen_44_part_00